MSFLSVNRRYSDLHLIWNQTDKRIPRLQTFSWIGQFLYTSIDLSERAPLRLPHVVLTLPKGQIGRHRICSHSQFVVCVVWHFLTPCLQNATCGRFNLFTSIYYSVIKHGSLGNLWRFFTQTRESVQRTPQENLGLETLLFLFDGKNIFVGWWCFSHCWVIMNHDGLLRLRDLLTMWRASLKNRLCWRKRPQKFRMPTLPGRDSNYVR